MPDTRLADLSLYEFVQAVASADQPVPAGGSVAALAGSASAALLVLVCDVLERHTPGVMTQPRSRARDLQQQLIALI
ncbi:MAG: cyclodeaminase/cyclohydrolase family protein [Chloroflexi bacterium]|nr:cyclodeaminase/cyclohydrolase family protein [Chloroflexota bacterium]